MTSTDKMAIGWSVGIVAVFIALAIGSESLQSSSNTNLPVRAPIQESPSTQAETIAGESAVDEEMVEDVMSEDVMVEEEMVEDVMSGESTEESLMSVVIIPADTAYQGCEIDDQCYIPSVIDISPGESIIWINEDTSAHTVTSGSPQRGPTWEFDSSLILPDDTFVVDFPEAGTYDYFCLVHPWRMGVVNVS